ncbi:unnamed protein product [Brugia pahangi]|uniref:Uncharacterized protein n=1 Tax=Brugia pahangi TaxID=6280 RepID=A0A0N4TK32_BRUPA|nr:unnamed protein product [Brugia pahangi]
MIQKIEELLFNIRNNCNQNGTGKSFKTAINNSIIPRKRLAFEICCLRTKDKKLNLRIKDKRIRVVRSLNDNLLTLFKSWKYHNKEEERKKQSFCWRSVASCGMMMIYLQILNKAYEKESFGSSHLCRSFRQYLVTLREGYGCGSFVKEISVTKGTASSCCAFSRCRQRSFARAARKDTTIKLQKKVTQPVGSPIQLNSPLILKYDYSVF